MDALNPMQLISLLRGGNPQQVVQQLIQTNYPNDPTMQQLMQYAQQGNTQALNQYAQQLFARSGRDFQSEFRSLMDTVKKL
jgi:hypothetical protein